MDLRLEDINFSYPDHQVLDAITCQFSQGGFHVILGPNGSGKTTLLDIMSGFTSPEKGRVYLAGTPVKRMSKRNLARKISLVSQSYEISFPFTVEEVVLMGRHPYIDRFSHLGPNDQAKADEAMEMTGISHLKRNRITEISGGEKQRCVFARALCQDTPVLLLDEAFANMDINHTLQLMKVLKQRTKRKKQTIIAVLHDLNLAAGWADTLLFLKSGKILVQGRTAEVFTDKNIKAVFNINSRVEFNDFTQSRQAFFKA